LIVFYFRSYTNHPRL